MKSETKKRKKVNTFFITPEFSSDGNPHKPIKELTRVGIFRARDLIFKKGQKNYNKNVFMKIKEIKGRVKTLQNDQSITKECPLKIRLEEDWFLSRR